MATLSLRNLVKIYHGRQVVNSVSLNVESGVVAGLLGPNGAGKTTTFYMAVGMVRPDGGQVFLDDEDTTNYPMYLRARKGVGYLPQETSIFRKLTVKQNIMAILEIVKLGDERHISKSEQKDRADRLLNELGIRHLADQNATVLSGGERRRLEIARALATDPCFILLDEPFAGVDPLAVIDIKNIIAHLRQREIGVLISDHNVRETLGVCDNAYILSDGKIIESGSPEKIASSQTARRIYLGDEFRL
ncbi:LPS export ABC transporter ATP-binding protein [Desulfonema magnum]|uniref:Lipopolysaccharide export system, ATP-binding protein n=1 Tax=Desulfonema magnum TaxID=45655 RepID=A0A975BJH5_9BACT|nr:LPS export ABC transporter ATP-binding protein [Desulfonema magnum]QTA86451.1 Lipopolysaccharide export system, ATP-binding protein [Desulfonema magnum]